MEPCENIADSGGIRCALEASKKNNHHSDEEFFANWARVWRSKASNEYRQLLLRWMFTDHPSLEPTCNFPTYQSSKNSIKLKNLIKCICQKKRWLVFGNLIIKL